MNVVSQLINALGPLTKKRWKFAVIETPSHQASKELLPSSDLFLNSHMDFK